MVRTQTILISRFRNFDFAISRFLGRYRGGPGLRPCTVRPAEHGNSRLLVGYQAYLLYAGRGYDYRMNPNLTPNQTFESSSHQPESLPKMYTRSQIFSVVVGLLLAAAPLVSAADFFYNDVTGKSQWEEPTEAVAYEDDQGRKYWYESKADASTWEVRIQAGVTGLSLSKSASRYIFNLIGRPETKYSQTLRIR